MSSNGMFVDHLVLYVPSGMFQSILITEFVASLVSAYGVAILETLWAKFWPTFNTVP